MLPESPSRALTVGLTAFLLAVTAAVPAPAQSSKDACLAKNDRVAYEIVRTGSDDHYLYKFEERTAEARALCVSGRTGEAYSRMAEILSDLRIAGARGRNN